jgi:hypothetical protein
MQDEINSIMCIPERNNGHDLVLKLYQDELKYYHSILNNSQHY